MNCSGRRLRQRGWTLSGSLPCFTGFMTAKTVLLSMRWIALIARSVVRSTAGSAHHPAVWRGFAVAFDQALAMEGSLPHQSQGTTRDS